MMLESFKDKGDNTKSSNRGGQGNIQNLNQNGGAVRSILRPNDPAMESFDPNDDLEDLINGKKTLSQDNLGINAKAKAGAKVNANGFEQDTEVRANANVKVNNQMKQNADPLKKQQTTAKINKQSSNQLQRLEDMEERDDIDDLEDEIGDLSLEEIKSLDKEDGLDNEWHEDGFNLGKMGDIPDDQPLELLRRGTTQIFALDADNELSYSKMQALVNSSHPRMEIEGKNGKTFKQMPFCKTRIGWHCCCRPCRRSDINKYGEGTSYYFKTLKFLNILFLIATIVNVPLFVMYSVGGGTNNQTGLKYYLSGLSLAYMGTNYLGCNFDQVTLPSDSEVSMYFSCEQGFLCDLKSFGLDNSPVNQSSNSSSSCNQDGFIYYDQYCNMTQFNETVFNYLTDTYDNQCKDKQSCNYTVSLAKLPTSCRNFTGTKLFFSQAQCAVTGINLSSSSYLDKSQIALIIAIFDVAFAIILGIALLILKCLQDLEHLEIKGITLDAAKFTLQLSGLPTHKNIYYLKAEIWKWAEGQLKRIQDEGDEDEQSNKHLQEEGETRKSNTSKKTSPKSNKVANRTSNPIEQRNQQSANKTIQDEGEDENQLIQQYSQGADRSPLNFEKQFQNNKIAQNYEREDKTSSKRGDDLDENDERVVEAKKNQIVDITLGLNDYQNVIHLCYINMFYKQLRLCYLRLEKIMMSASPQMSMKGPGAPSFGKNVNAPPISPIGGLKGPDGLEIKGQKLGAIKGPQAPNLEGLQGPDAPNLNAVPNIDKPDVNGFGDIAAPQVGDLKGPSPPNLKAGIPDVSGLDPKKLKMKMDIEKQIEAIKLRLSQRLELYDIWVQQNVQTGICAFIQFRSMLDMIRFLTGFELTFFENCCFGCAKKKPHIQAKMLQGQWPAMLKAPDPANLLWVNLGYSKCNTFFRRLFIAIISIILMAGSFIAIIYAKDFEKQVQLRYNMNTDCGTNTYTQTQVIYQEQQAQLSIATSFNYLHCYCLQQYKKVGTGVVDIKFTNGNYYCKDWAYDYAISNMFVYVIAFIIVACNIIVKFILRFITFFEKPKTGGMRSFSIMIKIFCIQFVNTVMILILVNWRITSKNQILNGYILLGKYEAVVEGYTYLVPKPIFGDNFVIFSGRYSDFTPEFFKTVGTTLLLTMIINIVSPNFINFGFCIMKKLKQCCDRGCTLDKRRTKLLIQEDYEALYTGPELLFEGRYATLLTTFFACLFLSFGMPLFYVVGFLSFFFTFWVDKYLFLRHYRLPPLGDRNLATWTRLLMCVAVMFHLIIAFMMISNNALFGTYCGSLDFSSFKETLTTTLQAIPFIYIIFDPKRFDYGHSILLFVVMFAAVAVVVLVIVLGSIIYTLYMDCKKSLKRCKKYCRPDGCCSCCGKISSCCNAKCCSNGCSGCLKKMFVACFACACCTKCKDSCKANCRGCLSTEGCLRCGCLKTSCCKKTFSCCFKGESKKKVLQKLIVDIMEGMRALIDYKPIISFDFYKEISLYELRLLYLRTNYELKRLIAALGGDRLAFTGPKGSMAVELDVQHPLAFVELKDFYLQRKAAIELEIRARLLDLKAKAKISGEINLNIEAGLLKGLDAAIQLKGGLIHLKRLSGLFSYDIKFSPEYMHCIKMKEKLPELRKILGQDKKEIQQKQQDNRK